MKIGSIDESRSQSNNRIVNSINMGSSGISLPHSQFSDSDARTSSKLSSAGLSVPVHDSQNNLQTLGHTFHPSGMEGRVSMLGGSGIGIGIGMQGRRHRDSESFAESTGHLISGVSTRYATVLYSTVLYSTLCCFLLFLPPYLISPSFSTHFSHFISFISPLITPHPSPHPPILPLIHPVFPFTHPTHPLSSLSPTPNSPLHSFYPRVF